jgi:hypothetical protein
VDPVTRNALPADPVDAETVAFLAQDNTASVGRGIEKASEQDTTISIYTALFPAGTPIASNSRVVDSSAGETFEVIGKPAKRAGLATGVAFVACQLRLISDLQGA